MKPPQDEAAEQSVLGAAMLSTTALDELLTMVRPGDFYAPRHETIWTAIGALVQASQPVDALTVCRQLQQGKDLERVGGPAYLHTLISVVPTAANAAYYARIVRQHAVNRSLTEVAARIAQLGFGGGDASENLAAAQTEILGLDAPQMETGRMLGPIVEEVMEAVEAGGTGVDGVPWPYERDMPPLAPGRLTVVAGRPGMGKSVAVLDAARHVAIRLGLPVGLFTLEMSAAEVGARAAAAEAGIPLPNIQDGRMRAQDWERWARKLGPMSDAPLWIDDHPHADPAYIRSECRRLQRSHGDLGLVVVDYLQLMQSTGKVESRQQEISQFSRALKLLAKDLACPVIAVSQLNRGPEQRQDKRPQMSDLRESGAVEQDADQVILVFREDFYELESPRAGEVDLIVAKNRSGPTTTVTLAAQLSMARFMPMAVDPGWQPERAGWAKDRQAGAA